MSGMANGGEFNLAGGSAFFLYELRRGATAVGVGLVTVALLLVVPRLLPSLQRVDGDDVRVAAAFCAVFLLLPLLGVFLAFGGWARERSDGTLGWLYARPLSSSAIFALRLAAFVATLGTFAAAALLLCRATPAALLDHLVQLGEPYVYAPLVLILPAVAFFASATASRGQVTPMLVAAVGALAALALLPELPLPSWELLADPAAPGLRRGLLLFVLFPAALVAGAWGALRVAVVDRGSRWRGVGLAAAVAVAGTLVSTALAAQQIWGDPWQVVAVRALAGGGEMHLLSGHGYDPAVLAVELVDGESRHRVRGIFLGPQVFPSPRGELVVVDGERTRRSMRWIGADGSERSFAFDRRVEPVGWSTDGRRFALSHSGAELARGLLLLDADSGGLRPVPLPWLADAGPGAWSMAWIDDSHLLVWSYAEGGWWAVTDAAGRRVAEAGLDAGQRLLPVPPLWLWSLSAGGGQILAADGVPRRAGRMLAWRYRGERRDLVALDAAGGLEVIAERPVPATAERFDGHHDQTLGVTGDGTAVWVEDGVVTAAPPGGEPYASCRLPDGFTAAAFRGAAGRRAAWGPLYFASGSFDALFVCDLARGEGRRIADLGPWGHPSAQVTADGLLTPTGLRPFDG